MESKTQTITLQEVELSICGTESGVPIYKTSPELPINYNSSYSSSKIEKKDVNTVQGAFVLNDVLTEDECKQFIELTEKMGYSEATVSTFQGMVSMPDVRNNERVIWQAADCVWQKIWDRVRHLIPETLTLRGDVQWKAVGLNERFRFYKYSPGQEFKPHFDGCFPRSSDEMTLLTFIIYLNEPLPNSGGETTFFPKNGKPVKVSPKRGNALIFCHGRHPLSPYHEGTLLTKGNKYVLRTDVMYKKQTK